MSFRQAIIPAASRGLKPYPAWDTVEKLLHPVFDHDGLAKPVLQIIAQEVVDAGAEEVVLVVRPDEEAQYQRLLSELIRTLRESPASQAGQITQAEELEGIRQRLRFAVQEEPLGFGHALWCAQEFISDEHWLLCPSDHLFLHHPGAPSAGKQISAAYAQHAVAISTVEALGVHQIGRYGVVAGLPMQGKQGLWTINRVLEKPSPTQAELYLETPGLRRNSYLCFSGLHILPSTLFEQLDERIRLRDTPDWAELTPVLDAWAQQNRFLALAIDGHHQDIGTKYGLLEAQLERALCGPDRAAILAQLSVSLANDSLTRDSDWERKL
jgi:UTP--glucose-1-phosphate uridylyltransferase